MTLQFRLPGLEAPRQLRPTADRAHPLVWVRRLCVLSALEPGQAHVVRTITLRRGLNIVWAPPKPREDGNALFRDAVASHTAGKTTLCRLIRHVLGEPTFASETTRGRIRERFPSGWVVGEVVINGTCWTVARPFAVGPHPFAARGVILEQVHDATAARSDLHTFLAELHSAAVDSLPARRFPATNESIRWDHLLPWLARDQECRFAALLEWRHSSTGSGAPALGHEERQFLVRSVLGLISDEERAEQRRNAELIEQKKEAEHSEPLLVYQASVDHGRLCDVLGMELPPPSDDLFGAAVSNEIEGRSSDLKSRIATLEEWDRRPECQAALEGSLVAEANADRDLDDAETKLSLERTALAQLKGEARKASQAVLLASLPPPREYCNVPMRTARERGCPLAASRPIELSEKRSELTAADEVAAQEAIVQALQQLADEKRSAVSAARAQTAEARRSLVQASSAYDEERGRLLEERAQLQHAERLAKQAADAWRRAGRQRGTVEELRVEIERSYEHQNTLRRERDEALGRFSAAFDYVVRALLGDEVEASVEASGRNLVLRVDHHGERESAALATIKLLAFDLAALTESIAGRGAFPRFLVHDGPHEADMDPGIYERLFLYGKQLEEWFGEDPGFQYIITTTAPPPEALRRAPWLIEPVLDASRAEGRLLGVDL